MKQSFLLSLLLAAASALWSQPLVITEILYNPPDGPDTLEFIEIYNNGQDVVNLMGYTLDGVEFTFPSFNLESQEYVLVAKDSVAMLSAFGVTAFQWVSGGLNNGG
ncbi:MAG TPA: lamin tail domain-containing protein, partial [Flavilitoribacter sp.]|nr:lamin tail domain-containing protein [Flavilitoribacter sp.]